jgi:hypothetical protein
VLIAADLERFPDLGQTRSIRTQGDLRLTLAMPPD